MGLARVQPPEERVGVQAQAVEHAERDEQEKRAREEDLKRPVARDVAYVLEQAPVEAASLRRLGVLPIARAMDSPDGDQTAEGEDYGQTDGERQIGRAVRQCALAAEKHAKTQDQRQQGSQLTGPPNDVSDAARAA